MSDVIRTDGLIKSFGRTRALDGLDLRVSQGEVHGFLGPNGAGKSTAIRILLGMLRADGGTATVLAADPWRAAARIHHEIAYVPGDVALWPNLTGGQIIDLLTSLRGGADPALRQQLIRDFDLDPRKRAGGYSKGNRQKVALVAALARPARLYLFDEPTSGLDPLMEDVFRSQVERVRSDGATVLLSSHILSEVERLCDRVTIIRAGRTIEFGSLDDLRHLTRTSIRVHTTATAGTIQALPGVHDLTSDDGRLEFDVDTEHLQSALTALTAAGVQSLEARPPSLEQLFLSHYAHADDDGAASR